MFAGLSVSTFLICKDIFPVGFLLPCHLGKTIQCAACLVCTGNIPPLIKSNYGNSFRKSVGSLAQVKLPRVEVLGV